MAVVAVAAMGLPQWAIAQDSTQPAKKDSTRVEREAPATARDLRELKELIEAQQKQIDELRQQAQQREEKLQQTEQQLAETKKSADDASQKAAAAVSSDEVAALKADVNGVKETLTNTILTAQDEQKRTSLLENTLGRFRWSGDARVRWEDFNQSGAEARNRERIRIRFGFDSKLGDDFSAGVALATGGFTGSFASGSEPAYDGTSTNETLTGDFNRKNISLDRGFVTYNPKAHPWISVTGGKFAYTWARTSVTFDPDLNPEGFSEKLSFDVKNSFVKNVSLVGMQLSYNETYKQTTPAPDSWAYGFQAGMKLQPASWWTLTPTYTLLNWKLPNAILTNNDTAAFNPNGISNCVNSTATPTKYCSGFLYSDLILANVFTTPWKRMPLNLTAEFERNLHAAGVVATDGSRHYRRNAYFADLSLGQQKNRNDVQVGYTFNREEQDAAISAFGESDQRWPTNVLQHKLYANYKIRSNVQLGFTEWIGRALDSSLPVIGGWAYAPGYGPGTAGAGLHEPMLKRSQIDLVFTF
jgi:hypothetical protein